MILKILKKACPIPNILDFNTYVFVGPHPDDIEVSSALTVKQLVSLGKKVIFIVVTDGSAGALDSSLKSEEIKKIRHQEALNSAKFLGVSDVRFLDYLDGNTSKDYDDIVKSLVKQFVDIKPDIVFCPDHTVRSECHFDHLNVGKAVTDSSIYSQWDRMTSRFNIKGSCKPFVIAYYFTDKPNSYVKCKDLNVRIEALKFHKTQFDEETLNNFKKYFTLRCTRFGLRSCKGKAEGFRVLSQTHQHCFPEASEFK